MKKYILTYICDVEGWKTAIKQLHWDANSLSQHQLCDDIATIISDYQDKVAEVEQSISGKLPVNNLKGTPYKITNLKKFVEDVIKGTKEFYKKLQKEGDEYIGMRSDTEAVLSDLQRQLYLVDFTIKESLKQRLRNKINEGRVTISNGKEKYSLTENELREFVSKAIRNVNKRRLSEATLDAQMALHELELYMNSFEEFRRKSVEVGKLLSETGHKDSAAEIGAVLKAMTSARNNLKSILKQL
jgi:DNA-binding ferritin-like protein